ncbi:MAG: tRNA (N6-isopentenyl adenosine(37)-C2)-methylthiotransferase MiaB [bacterium]
MAFSYYLQVYGCQMNFYEADLVRTILDRAGYQETEIDSLADVLLMMTCSVREHAEKRALVRLAQFIGFKKSPSTKLVGVLGCMAQNLGYTLVNKHGVDVVVGPDQYLILPDLLSRCRDGQKPQVAVEITGERYDQICPIQKKRVTAYVTIMRGCSNFCSYCIVPYVKGPERSRAAASIIAEIRQLVENGVKEVALIGQNVLAYQDHSTDFCRLLEKVCEIDLIERVRFLTSHPRDLNETVIRTMSALSKVCPQLHLPVQSGSDRILKLMNRGYTRNEYLEKIEMVRTLLPEAGLTTDIIVGFPSETDEDFAATLDVIHRARFDYAYMFKFSSRKGTAVAEWKAPVPPEKASERLRRLVEVQNQITRESSYALLGRKVEVLIEGRSRRGNGSFGRTRNGKAVVVDQRLDIGKLITVQIKGVRGWTPVGEIITADPTAEPTIGSQSQFQINWQGG